MNRFTVIAGIALLILCVGCREMDTAASLPNEKRKELILSEGMNLSEARRLLAQVDAQEVRNAYHLPWESSTGPGRGYHIYYDLKDGTCVQLQIDQSRPTETVVAFGVGAKGRPYTGKMEWFEDDEAGRIKHPSIVKLYGEQKDAANRSQPIRSETNQTSSSAGDRR